MISKRAWFVLGMPLVVFLTIPVDAYPQSRYQYHNHYTPPASVAFGVTQNPYGGRAVVGAVRTNSGGRAAVVGIRTPSGESATVIGVRQPNGQTRIVITKPSPSLPPPSVHYGSRPTPSYGYRPPIAGQLPTPLPSQLPQYGYSNAIVNQIPRSYGTLFIRGYRHHFCHHLLTGCRRVTHNAVQYFFHNGLYYRPRLHHGQTVYVVVSRPF